MFDVVSKEEIDVTTAQYSFEYNGVIYYFTTAENMEAFKADPEKYLKKLQEKEAAPPESK
jgi:YHS domain-containing protein